MPINIILDKSTFQSLSYNDIIILNRYYKHNITPILTMEVLGDLKKEAQEGRALPKDRVSDFARKLFPHNSVVNAHYQKLLKDDLLGKQVGIDGRPVLEIAKTVETAEGQKGWLVQETAEEKSILKWKDGFFEEADYELSKLWRDNTTQKNILINLKASLAGLKGGDKVTSFEELAKYVDVIMENPVSQQALISTLIRFYNFIPYEGVKVMQRWISARQTPLKEFAPYAYHCLKVNLLFHLGLVHDLVTTRPTNKVDLEYLYYLPFCDIFSSNDKMHFNLIPFLIKPNQIFIPGPELKNDLTNINKHLLTLDEATQKEFLREPPILEQSFTFKTWQQFFNYPKKQPYDRIISEAELEKRKEKMDQLIDATNGEPKDFINGDGSEFVVKQYYISKNDPCVCGSGKRVIDCCITEDQFNAEVKKTR